MNRKPHREEQLLKNISRNISAWNGNDWDQSKVQVACNATPHDENEAA